MAIEQNTFDSASVSLDQENFGKIPESQFDTAMASKMQEDIAESLTPEDIKPSDANKVDVQLQGNIAINLKKKDLFTGDLSSFEEPDAESASDKIDAVFKSSSPFTTDPTRLDLSGRNTGPDAVLKPVGISGKTAEEELAEFAEEDPDTPTPVGELNFEKITDPAKRYAIKGYESIRDFFTNPPPEIQTTGAYDISQGGYRQPYSTGYLGTYPNQSSIGLSSAPPASLAGQGNVSMLPYATGTASTLANLGVRAGTQTGLATATSLGASGTTPFQTSLAGSAKGSASSAWATLGNVASVYGIYDGIKKGDLFSAGTSLITLLNPATAIPIAFLHAAKFALSSLLGGGRPKRAFGGVDLKASSNKLMTTRGYGYNAFKRETGQAVGASIADYVNQYVKDFGLQFNGNRWGKFLQENPRLERYDSTGETGYSDPSTMIRAILETKGMVTGTPTYNGQPITSQEDYKAKMEEFNKRYQDTAYKNGGLVDPTGAGIDVPLSGEFTTVQTRTDTGRPDTSSPTDYYGRHTRNIVSIGSRPASLFEMLHRNLAGTFPS